MKTQKVNMVRKAQSILDNRKTYLAVIAVIVLAVIEVVEIYTVPVQVYYILAALGLGFLRGGVKKLVPVIEELIKLIKIIIKEKKK